MNRKTGVSVSFGLCLLTSIPAVQADTSTSGMNLAGRWRCSAHGNIPIAVLAFNKERYTLEDTPNMQWKKRAGSLNGSGKIQIAPNQLTPLSGPLVSELEIKQIKYTASANGRSLYLTNKPGGMSLLQCVPES